MSTKIISDPIDKGVGFVTVDKMPGTKSDIDQNAVNARNAADVQQVKDDQAEVLADKQRRGNVTLWPKS